MPELPEVETIKQELGKAVIGNKIKQVIINNPRVIKGLTKSEFSKQLTGKTIKSVLRKGKLLIIKLSSNKFLTIHLRMTGQLIYPGNAEKSRVSFKFSNEKILDFNDQRLLGELKIVDNWKLLPFIKNLGPEPSDLTLQKFKQKLSKRKKKIKSLLMDQSFIAGVGNLYAAEALFRAKIHPEKKVNSLSDKEKQLLFKELKKVLKQATLHRGSSIDEYVQLSGQAGNYTLKHKVYGRQGKPCLVCGTPIKRITVGGRGTYFCPKCQRK